MLRIFISILSLAVLVSCSNDFDLTESGKETPVIYGLLSPNDTAIYIRVEKSFISEDIEPAVLAQDPNNLYYDNITVELQNLNKPELKYILKKVDGNAEGHVREGGFFSNAPNFLYKLHANQLSGGVLGDTTPYQLTVRQENGEILASAKTRALRKMQDKDIVSPSTAASLGFDYTKNFTMAFLSDPYAHIHDIYLVISYTEIKNGVSSDKILRWPITKNYIANSPNNLVLQYTITGRNFYEFLKSNLDADPNISRFLKNGTLEIYSGGLELKDYINIVKANIGITSSGEVPSYTNINNGIGLFSSRTSIARKEISFTLATRDSVANGIITKDLNFN